MPCRHCYGVFSIHSIGTPPSPNASASRDPLPRFPHRSAEAGGRSGARAVAPIAQLAPRLEAAIWAAAYVWLGALDSPKDAILYSVDTMTTRGASGLMLQQHWQMMGALEAAGGMLLFGISTAYIFAVMQLYWPMLSKQFIDAVTHDELT